LRLEIALRRKSTRTGLLADVAVLLRVAGLADATQRPDVAFLEAGFVGLDEQDVFLTHEPEERNCAAAVGVVVGALNQFEDEVDVVGVQVLRQELDGVVQYSANAWES